jgi:hypothetical protein
LEKFLAPLRHTVFWKSWWWVHTDLTHFQAVLELLRPYTTITGKRLIAVVAMPGC